MRKFLFFGFILISLCACSFLIIEPSSAPRTLKDIELTKNYLKDFPQPTLEFQASFSKSLERYCFRAEEVYLFSELYINGKEVRLTYSDMLTFEAPFAYCFDSNKINNGDLLEIYFKTSPIDSGHVYRTIIDFEDE
jgi:hypothetical protein